MAFKKKLHRYRPGSEPAIEVRTIRKRTKPVPCDPRSIEHGVRQFLADKVMGNLAGMWLLVPELLRLGAWDLVCGWTGQGPAACRTTPGAATDPRGGTLPHRPAPRRTLNQRIFELVNGLPFLAADIAIHDLLGARTVSDSLRSKWPWARSVAPRVISAAECWPLILTGYAASASGTCLTGTMKGATCQDGSDVLRARRRYRPTRLFHHRHLGAYGCSRSRGITQIIG